MQASVCNAMTMTSAPVQEGELVSGKYRIGRVLGEGGMGVVVAALHVELDQQVALKFLRPSVAASASAVARFTREARAAAKIRSEHVARVLDVGAIEASPYMVMEYLEGEDLSEALERRGPLPVDEGIGYVLQACEAIAEAHALGIVHRDLKPANLYLARRPTGKSLVKVLDFGISKIASSGLDPRLTSTSEVFGSPPYMPPEQLTSAANVDVRSDIWSLGVTLFELLTNRRPFFQEFGPELIAAILTSSPTPPRVYRADLPEALEQAILRCLNRDSTQRFQHIAAFAAAIAPFGPARSSEAVERVENVLGHKPALQALPTLPVLSASAPAARPEPATDGTWSKPEQAAPAKPRSPHTLLIAAAVIGAASLLLIAGLAVRDALRPAIPDQDARADTPTAAAPTSSATVNAPTTSASAAPATPPSSAVAAPSSSVKEPTKIPEATRPAASPRSVIAAPSRPACARLLERQSLGETLTLEEHRLIQQCRH